MNEGKATKDVKVTLYHLKRAIAIFDIIANKSSHITLLDLETAKKKYIINFDDTQISALLFKLPNLPLCYIDNRVVDVLEYALRRHPKIKFALSFKVRSPNVKSILRLPHQKGIRSYAIQRGLKASSLESYTWIYS